jgi:DNA mismatch repair protein MutS
MAGKSTYLRQIGLIQVLAQMGSWIPAESARLGIVDRLFTRVGASDNLARGQSTFLVEMIETANILHNATDSSLVLLDEIGRGTATFDGLAIAWSVSEWIHDGPAKPMSVFATHYHELTELEAILPRVRNFKIEVAEYGDDIIFMKCVKPGPSDRSYGIHVGKLAGLPGSVVRRANEILGSLEGRRITLELGPVERETMVPNVTKQSREQMSFLHADQLHPILTRIRDLDIDSVSPRDALGLLFQFRRDIEQ